MLVKNGIIVQLKHAGIYQGIEGENWYFSFPQEDGDLKRYYDNNIDISWQNEDYVDCCSDMQYIKKYIEALQKNKLNYRILLCETNQMKPVFQDYQFKTEFLGFDYAYAGGSFYSCVNNDIVSKRISEMIEIRLNNNGLFEKEEELFDFIQMREKLIVQYSESVFEKGDFIRYKLSEILKI